MNKLPFFAFFSLPLSAFAVVPEYIQTALDTGFEDAILLAGTFLVAVIAVYGVKFIRRGL